MDQLIIEGGHKLKGTITSSASKNATLPILTGCLLTGEEVLLKNIPGLRDINTTKKLLETLGSTIEVENDCWKIKTPALKSHEAPYELVKTMRASVLVLGPLLTRFKKARVSLPGGCAIGTRPVDIHLSNLEKMGAKINLEQGYIEAECPEGLKGQQLVLSFPSVGATENIMMAATLAKGTTIIENAAKEPEIIDLAQFLIAMGAQISGAGTSKIEIQGVKSLSGCEYTPMSDRVENATYLLAGAITKSKILVAGAREEHIESVLMKFNETGIQWEQTESGIQLTGFEGEFKGIDIETAPFPGFPTDVQAQFMAFCTQIDGASVITENIFENRFMHVPELQRMGADITLKGRSAFIKGKSELKGAPVMCTDLRASAALVLAALVAEGETTIQRIYHLERGYERIDEKLLKLGAKVRRENPNN